MANLGPQFIKNSYQDLVQITASNALAKGDGTSISNISVTASWAQNASDAINAQTASFLSGAFLQGGNSFGTTALLGTNDNQNLQLETSGSVRMTIISSSGNVGIGTTTPSRALEIVNSSAPQLRIRDGVSGANLDLQSDGNGQARITWGGNGYVAAEASALRVLAQGTAGLSLETNAATKPVEIKPNGTTRLIVSASGNVGIGTTTPTSLLQVAGRITSTELYVTNGDAIYTTNGSVGIGTSGPTSTNRLQIRGSGATSATTALRVENSNASASLVVRDDGNVGIGTTSPSVRLHISGTSATNELVYLMGDASQGSAIRFNRGSSYGWRMGVVPISNFTIEDVSYSTVRFQINNTSGLIGINTTSPNARLHISGANNEALLIASSSTAPSALFVSGSGNVGIGTATPSTTLQVAGTSSLQNIVFDTNSTYDIGTTSTRVRNIWSNGSIVGVGGFFNNQTIYNSVSLGPGDFTPTARLHISGSDSAQMMRISSPSNANILFVSGSGNVGIGTSNPLSRLHISASSGNEFLRVTSGSQNILNIRSGSAVFFAGTGVAPTSGFDLDVQGTGTANGGAVRIAGNSTEWRFTGTSTVNRSSTGNPDMFNVTMGGTSATLIQNPMKVEFNANQSSTGGGGYTVLRVNATHATTAGTGSKLLQTWEFGGVQRSVVNITGSIGVGITRPSASVHISSSLGLAPILAITPHHPLPTTDIPTGSFMVSSSIPPKPFFWDGTTWNALY